RKVRKFLLLEIGLSGCDRRQLRIRGAKLFREQKRGMKRFFPGKLIEISGKQDIIMKEEVFITNRQI
ncbi:MAG TPA: hypothetical protein P5523_06965, partial [Bacteroidales bacterium]|nr:hypothetical protein [Bacteroidales bacterium]